MNTLIGSFVGFVVSCVLCGLVYVACVLGLMQPNVVVEDGQTYTHWWTMLFGTIWVAFVLFGMIFDTLGAIQYFSRKNA